jgi:SRSO17 transposase
MDFITDKLPEEVEAYLRQYDDLFARRERREHFRLYVAGLISERRRKNIGQIMAKVVEGSYPSGHHFLAEAPWSADAINRRRLKLWQSDPTTRMPASSWWIQDDTGQERRPRGASRSPSRPRA